MSTERKKNVTNFHDCIRFYSCTMEQTVLCIVNLNNQPISFIGLRWFFIFRSWFLNFVLLFLLFVFKPLVWWHLSQTIFAFSLAVWLKSDIYFFFFSLFVPYFFQHRVFHQLFETKTKQFILRYIEKELNEHTLNRNPFVFICFLHNIHNLTVCLINRLNFQSRRSSNWRSSSSWWSKHRCRMTAEKKKCSLNKQNSIRVILFDIKQLSKAWACEFSHSNI